MAAYYEYYFIGTFLLFMMVDRIWSFREKRQSVIMRWGANYGLYLFAWCMQYGLTFIAILLFAAIAEGHLGLFSFVDAPWYVVAVVTLVVMDLSDYVVHRLAHRWTWFWRIHRVHHSDRDYDFTTGLRFHPLETVIDVFTAWAVIALLGTPVELLIGYFMFQTFINFLVHSNIALPPRMDRAFAWLVVTPSLHRTHHGEPRALHDSNYGVVLSVWDRLFGTLQQDTDQRRLETGIIGFEQPEQLSFFKLLAMPFSRIGMGESRQSALNQSV